ncbi:hypothetical protein LTSESEN_3309 [Salmonella enterica subsp. enterica serovar Senftenberg str. A4-543]|uniref:Uncharacterized protein n=1 Tax=Salmonella enterica subsp. enterica serovar Senftenberg str. A4-543 TaxID=913082 RepID=G5R1T2_SALSE|nr:hypothetical protein LTSESEN_3309 [Salmonella enterica subsp. enterica serovar Senftenberg str. A4-543]
MNIDNHNRQTGGLCKILCDFILLLCKILCDFILCDFINEF